MAASLVLVLWTQQQSRLDKTVEKSQLAAEVPEAKDNAAAPAAPPARTAVAQLADEMKPEGERAKEPATKAEEVPVVASNQGFGDNEVKKRVGGLADGKKARADREESLMAESAPAAAPPAAAAGAIASPKEGAALKSAKIAAGAPALMKAAAPEAE